MPRLRPTRIEHVVDGVRLRAQLTAAALEQIGDERAQRAGALSVLKGALFRGRMIAKERLEDGAGGLQTARLLSSVADEVISALYDFTTVHMFRARNPTEGERLAILAVGGYGRGALAPFSDVDLLFLRPYKQTAHQESVIEFMLYALWDLGFKVGHASRTVEECLRLAREDFTIRTALLEARPLVGDAALSAELKRRFREEVAKGTGAEFVAAKLKERDDRHARAGASRYMVEPNVKEGKGGLRDLNTLFWIAQYLHPSDVPSELVRLEEFTRQEVKAFLRAFDFLWAVRCFLHFTTGRAEERLSFDLQPEIAQRMGYGATRGGETPAVERFMRRYFLIAREVGVLTRIFCAKLEAEEAAKPKGLSRFLTLPFKAPGKRLESGFREVGGRLAIDGPEVFAKDPVNLLRLFRIADQRNLDLQPDAFAAAHRGLDLITPALRSDPKAVEAFLDVLARGRDTYPTLMLMNDAGVLGRFVPEFGGVVGQMQFNMYHAYTVDEHTLRAVGVIADVAAGRRRAEHPVSDRIFAEIADPEALFLAMLLHDTGKGGEGGQSVAGARTARAAAARMGLTPDRVDLIAWLVEHHLVMSDFAQKRDVADPATITAFARVVGDVQRLHMLLILTVADIRAVGPAVWNGWKGQLLRDLYGATAVALGEGADRVERRLAATASSARQRLTAAWPGDDPKTKAWADGMEDAYFNAFTAEEQSEHHALAVRADAQDGAAASAHVRQASMVSEAVVAARDRRGLFADLAQTFSALGANIVGARVYTSSTGVALDVFLIQDAAGMPFGQDNPKLLTRLSRALEKAARGEPPRVEASRREASGREAAFTLDPKVTIQDQASAAATVVEVSGRDRPGLLEALARALSGAGLSVQSAHIDSHGARAEDAFYVLDETGAKLIDPGRQAALREVLLDVLRDEPDAAPIVGKRQLPKAPASLAR